ncbi:hypothetical protein J6590_087258 [Homalodisca vitripennis]|nr:hypothetical protein J6590_087902 [Homalodisca vitripennis]KAG8305271.1 hypothetical protein J6590_072745 [Homalodisca vitripennis]KAG8324653.1 hypothetical protein J6590_087258 [Homalodisca vitripennis]
MDYFLKEVGSIKPSVREETDTKRRQPYRSEQVKCSWEVNSLKLYLLQTRREALKNLIDCEEKRFNEELQNLGLSYLPPDS